MKKNLLSKRKTKIKKITAVITTICLAAGIVAGCGDSKSNEEAAQTNVNHSESESKTNESGLELTITNTADVSTLDSTLATSAESMLPIMQTVEGLYKYNRKGEIELGLADSVDISEDGLQYTFKLKDAEWSDGNPITANDFVYSWKRLVNPDTGADYAYLLYVAGVKNAYSITYEGGDLETLGVKAEDDKTLVVELERPVAYFPSLTILPGFAPINEEFAESKGDQYGLGVDKVLASGPLVATEWEPGSSKLVLSKNEHYYDADNIEVESLTYQTITEAQEQILAWESKSTDEILLTGDYVEQYKNDEALQPLLASRMCYIYPNLDNEDLQNVNLRLALALSYDKDVIADNILKNGSIAANFACPKEFAIDHNGKTFREAADKTYLESDKEKAAGYYEKAKEELGKDSFKFTLLYDDSEELNNISQYIKSEIENTLPGVSIELKVQPKNARVELMKSGDFDLGVTFWGADYQDATTYLDLWTTGNSYNYGKWSNDEYDKLIKDVSGDLATDYDGRINNMVKAEEIILEDAGIFPIYQLGYAYLINAGITVPKSSSGVFLWYYAAKK